jgi:hypothetical protein
MGRGDGMNETEEFSRRAGAVLARFFRQNGHAWPAGVDAATIGTRVWAAVTAHGLPPALRPGDCGVPGGMSEEECAPLVAQVLGGDADATDALLVQAVKQLVKACLYPEFTVCRDSFREPTKDGGCRRQELERVRGRISGAHCVDCPYFVALPPAEHAEFLAREWRVGGAEALAAQREIFLPEDFRALRQWLHARARRA